MSELKTFSKKTFFVTGSRILGSLFGLILVGYMTKVFGVDQYGEFIFIYSFIEIVSVVVKAGMDQGLVALIPGVSKSRDVLYIQEFKKTILLIVIVFALLVSIILYILNI